MILVQGKSNRNFEFPIPDKALLLTRCERSDIEEYALHLVVLAHTYMVPALKRLCTVHFEQGQLNIDNVVDILQIARYFLISTTSHALFKGKIEAGEILISFDCVKNSACVEF